MTISEIKKWISRAYDMDRLVLSKINRKSNLKRLFYEFKLDVKSGYLQCDDGDVIIKYSDIIPLLDDTTIEEITNIVILQSEVRIYIEKIDNPVLKYILIQRYINFKRWKEICDELGYTRSNIMKLHIKALMHLSDQFKKSDQFIQEEIYNFK